LPAAAVVVGPFDPGHDGDPQVLPSGPGAAVQDVLSADLAFCFSTRDPRVASTVVGVSTPERVDVLIRNAEMVILGQLWDLVRQRLGG
jgi:hypothetical protein